MGRCRSARLIGLEADSRSQKASGQASPASLGGPSLQSSGSASSTDPLPLSASEPFWADVQEHLKTERLVSRLVVYAFQCKIGFDHGGEPLPPDIVRCRLRDKAFRFVECGGMAHLNRFADANIRKPKDGAEGWAHQGAVPIRATGGSRSCTVEADDPTNWIYTLAVRAALVMEEVSLPPGCPPQQKEGLSKIGPHATPLFGGGGTDERAVGGLPAPHPFGFWEGGGSKQQFLGEAGGHRRRDRPPGNGSRGLAAGTAMPRNQELGGWQEGD